ncbi:glycoside hydrolase family 65 protein [Calidifontibacter sp. DB0510]|uniref:Glycoside hydrolase family 65 protein n=1 Tax=Metallococcus carri TaxID=1656884 RepID=A0A967B648_9MICO|nr:glycoside hydrolase family 65 protein [Metallococcus carri]NHN56292.1 glycoside hydrolase family 65 protein [Metallococcus carri]NOP38656.1 glycoside hydrolase family 65 protein [Calidifontibacter sp. DB2511S]
MTLGHGFQIEPWQVREVGVDLGRLAQAESIFALANGHIGVRGNLDEGDPSGLPGTYLNSFYEKRPLPYAEAGYGFPESGQTVVNVTNGKIIRLLVDDQPLDLRYGTVRHQERRLDLRTGLLHRDLLWETPAGKQVRIKSTRLVSFTQRAILAVNYVVEAVDDPLRVVVQSELVTNEELPATSGDPRVAALLERPLQAEVHDGNDNRSLLIHSTKASKLRMAAAADHVLDNPEVQSHTYVEEDWARTTMGTALAPGQSLGFTKFVAYGWSSQRTVPALRDQVDAALSAALYAGWDGLVAEQAAYMEEFWDGADVEVDGDPAVQQAVRFALWHVLQAGARAEGRAIAAKGLTGPGYDGHSFWDTEAYVLPVLIATDPKAARDALCWRATTMDLARERAKTLHRRGVSFPWRTIRGQECSAYWPAGTAAFHINADISVAAARYVFWTGDEEFDREFALPLLVETARLWIDLGYHGDDGHFHIDGVTGPDEYSAIVDDNIFTNLMAARNLRYAAETAERWPEAAKALDVTDEELGEWRAASDVMAMPFDAERDVYQQDRGFTDHEVWDFEDTAATDRYPLLLHYPYFEIYRKQVIKQADLIMAMHWCGDEFTPEEKARAFEYYEGITVRDSSLSACAQSVIAAELGHLELAHDYLTEAALMDLRDLERNTADGVHVASLAGAWLALVCGFGGMRDHHGDLTFAPRLPEKITRLAFAIRWRGCKIRVDVHADHATYHLEDGPDAHVQLAHHGEPFLLTTEEPVSMPIERLEPLTPRPVQPPGREPLDADTTNHSGTHH